MRLFVLGRYNLSRNETKPFQRRRGPSCSPDAGASARCMCPGRAQGTARAGQARAHREAWRPASSCRVDRACPVSLAFPRTSFIRTILRSGSSHEATAIVNRLPWPSNRRPSLVISANMSGFSSIFAGDGVRYAASPPSPRLWSSTRPSSGRFPTARNGSSRRLARR
jgi:hypothetical protein